MLLDDKNVDVRNMDDEQSMISIFKVIMRKNKKNGHKLRKTKNNMETLHAMLTKRHSSFISRHKGYIKVKTRTGLS